MNGEAMTRAVAPADAQVINLWWLVRLRWVAICGQVLIILGVDALLGIRLPLIPLFSIVGFEALSNALCALWARQAEHVTDARLAALLAVDVALLTALLYLTGGPVNPFTFLYMVHITLAAVTLRPRHTWGLTGLALFGFGMLFWLPAWDASAAGAMATHHDHMRMHLEGMFVAFAAAAILIVYFVQRVTDALSQRDAELAAARDLAERHEKFASLATLAAGAAHELSTPLSTIAVVARELERVLCDRAEDTDSVADVRLIREQVSRCHDILQQMAADAGQGMGESFTEVGPAELLDRALAELRERARVEVSIAPDAAALLLQLPLRAVAQAVRAVIKNALQASAASQAVQVRVSSDAPTLRIEVQDHGSGIAPAVLPHVGEPFFTTKAPGEGMGLGLFLTRTLLARLDGRIDIQSTPGHGTRVVLWLPVTRSEIAGKRLETAA
jgi:two-component system sensor histidine kinase RegB